MYHLPLQCAPIEWGVLCPRLCAARHMQHLGDFIRRTHLMQLFFAIRFRHAESLDYSKPLLCQRLPCAHRISGLDCQYQRLLQHYGHGGCWWNGSGQPRIWGRREQSVFSHRWHECHNTGWCRWFRLQYIQFCVWRRRQLCKHLQWNGSIFQSHSAYTHIGRWRRRRLRRRDRWLCRLCLQRFEWQFHYQRHSWKREQRFFDQRSWGPSAWLCGRQWHDECLDHLQRYRCVWRRGWWILQQRRNVCQLRCCVRPGLHLWRARV